MKKYDKTVILLMQDLTPSHPDNSFWFSSDWKDWSQSRQKRQNAKGAINRKLKKK